MGQSEINYLWDKNMPRFKRYGMSAYTTFHWAHYIHGFSFIQSAKLMFIQIAELGVDYPGGPECTKYRSKQNIQNELDYYEHKTHQRRNKPI